MTDEWNPKGTAHRRSPPATLPIPRWVRAMRDTDDEGPSFARLEREEPGKVLVTFGDGCSAWRKAWTEVAP